jgi:predicted alpha/beta hydrolase
MHTVDNLILKTADGYESAATHFAADSNQFIVMGSATAVPHGFYKRFAEFAQGHGINVITVDYRGIGESKRGSLKDLHTTYAEWSKYDLAAAVDYAAARGKVWLVGHSLGGHAIGQLLQPNLLQAAYVCGTGSGWHGWMLRTERIKVWLLWNAFGHLMTKLYGYAAMSKMGIGEDIPAGVFWSWRKWCRYPHYFFDDPTAKAITDQFALVHIPIAAAVTIDDRWAPPTSRDAFFKGYSGATVDRIDLTPAALGVAQIGHMGYFRSHIGERLWPQILQWLAQHGLQVSQRSNISRPY